MSKRKAKRKDVTQDVVANEDVNVVGESESRDVKTPAKGGFLIAFTTRMSRGMFALALFAMRVLLVCVPLLIVWYLFTFYAVPSISMVFVQAFQINNESSYPAVAAGLIAPMLFIGPALALVFRDLYKWWLQRVSDIMSRLGKWFGKRGKAKEDVSNDVTV